MAKNTNKATKKDKKVAFVIGPIGDEGSEIRRRIDGLISALFRPALEDLGFKAIASHDIDESGSITKQIIDQLLNADLVVCDLTDNNPNVMYELAIRHAAQLPVVLIAEFGTEMPFDIGDQRTTFFINDPLGVNEFRPTLKSKIEAALSQKNLDNPISRVLLGKATASGDPFQDFMINQTVEIREMVSQILSTAQRESLESKLKEITERQAQQIDAVSRSSMFSSETIPILVSGPKSESAKLFKDLKRTEFSEIQNVERFADSQAVWYYRVPNLYNQKFLEEVKLLAKKYKKLTVVLPPPVTVRRLVKPDTSD